MSTKTEKTRFRTLPADEFSPARRVKVIVFNGVEGYEERMTVTCSGCYESEDGHPNGHYPWDEKAGCYIGAGCHECGYTGKRRTSFFVPFNPDDLDKMNDGPEEAGEVQEL